MKAPETRVGRAWVIIGGTLVVFAAYFAVIATARSAMVSTVAFLILLAVGIPARRASTRWMERGRR